MSPMLEILIIVVSIAILLVALHHYLPAAYNVIISYSIRILKGVVYAAVQFFNYVQGKPETTRLSDQETISQLYLKNMELIKACDLSTKQLQSVRGQLEDTAKKFETCVKEKTRISLELDKRNKEFSKLLENYDEIRGRLYPVSMKHVSEVFCREYEKMIAIIENAESSLYQLVEQEDTIFGIHSFVHYLQMKRQDDINTFNGWYLTLKYASSLTGAGALDIDAYTNYNDKIAFLRRNAFMRYYRPMLSALLLCMEHCRIRSCNQHKWNDCILQIIDKLKNSDITVNYIPTGAQYHSSAIENIIISESKNVDAPIGIVEEVLSIGINTTELDVPIQETEIIMNL